MSDNNSEEEGTENGLVVHSRIPSEKGLQYQSSTFEKMFNSAVSAWRRQSNKLLVEVSDSDSVDTIREQRGLFQNSLDTVCSIFEHLQSLKIM